MARKARRKKKGNDVVVKRSLSKSAEGEWACSVWFPDPAKAKALLWYLPYFGFGGEVRLSIDGEGVKVDASLPRADEIGEWLARLQDFEQAVRAHEKKNGGNFDGAKFKSETVLF